AELTTEVVDRDDGVAALVSIDSEYDHGTCLPLHSVMGDRTGRWAQLSWGDATLLSSHAGRSSRTRTAAQLDMATNGTEWWSEPAEPCTSP
ncbi:hypothetical protein, partial [Actinopolymorpha cephalotaxi]|uniref:hypothetical protein n=1 Tax=Actinopolymorpha cephalotaxi TaxID=504797 RepID=UPI001EDBCDBA